MVGGVFDKALHFFADPGHSVHGWDGVGAAGWADADSPFRSAVVLSVFRRAGVVVSFFVGAEDEDVFFGVEGALVLLSHSSIR